MNEEDPNGVAQHTSGAKLDAGKIRASLLLDFAKGLEAVANVATFGANKYTPGGWQHVEDAERRYTDALLRHLIKSRYEGKDSDSDFPHWWHIAWNALAIVTLQERPERRTSLKEAYCAAMEASLPVGYCASIEDVPEDNMLGA